MSLVEVKGMEYQISSNEYTWSYTGYRRLNENDEMVSAYIVPLDKRHTCAVWVSKEKLEQVLNFIEAIGGYE